MLDSIFKDGWEVHLLLYALVFYFFFYVVYPVIFRALMGRPTDYTYESIRQWQRKASFFGAVFLAPLFEEWWFTFLAYTSFLNFAQSGQEGIIILAVATFFALLHLPGDLRRINYRIDGQTFFHLLRGQLERFFFSLAAYFIYHWTGEIWVTILLHYFYNAVASIINFDIEDHPYFYLEGDGRLYMLQAMDLGCAVLACYFFYVYYSPLTICLLIGIFLMLISYYLQHRFSRAYE
jgi:membrane protease YdiL (CAAX protease family)